MPPPRWARLRQVEGARTRLGRQGSRRRRPSTHLDWAADRPDSLEERVVIHVGLPVFKLHGYVSLGASEPPIRVQGLCPPYPKAATRPGIQSFVRVRLARDGLAGPGFSLSSESGWPVTVLQVS
jgi:hypothetical protein